MAGTREGGLKAAKKNLERNPDFYREIGKIGGQNGTTGGFASPKPCGCDIFAYGHNNNQCAGRKGGVISKRSKLKSKSGA